MKTIKLIFCSVILLIAIVSCTEKKTGEIESSQTTQPAKLTPNENAGVDEILAFYGGICKYEFLYSRIGTDEQQKYFELELSKSLYMEKVRDKLEMPASNMAYIFYKNLKKERYHYSEIRCKIVLKDGRKKTFVYPIQELELVSRRMRVVEKVAKLLASKDYATLESMINGEEAKIEPKELIARIIEFEEVFGDITEFNPNGFRIDETKDGLKVLHISGQLTRSKQSSEFSVDLDLNGTSEEIFLIDFKF